MQRDIQGFLNELGKLTEKYHIYIIGCYCCGSPYLADSDFEDVHKLMENLTYDKKSREYTVKELEVELYEKDGVIYNKDGSIYLDLITEIDSDKDAGFDTDE